MFGPAFKRNSRWSLTQPVPDVGDEETAYAAVDKFYDFWFSFKSWREFPHADEEDVEQAESREEKRCAFGFIPHLSASKRLHCCPDRVLLLQDCNLVKYMLQCMICCWVPRNSTCCGTETFVCERASHNAAFGRMTMPFYCRVPVFPATCRLA